MLIVDGTKQLYINIFEISLAEVVHIYIVVCLAVISRHPALAETSHWVIKNPHKKQWQINQRSHDDLRTSYVRLKKVQWFQSECEHLLYVFLYKIGSKREKIFQKHCFPQNIDHIREWEQLGMYKVIFVCVAQQIQKNLRDDWDDGIRQN